MHDLTKQTKAVREALIAIEAAYSRKDKDMIPLDSSLKGTITATPRH